MDIATEIKSTIFLDQVIHKINFGPNTAVVIVKFKMAAHAKINDPLLPLLFLLGSLTQKTWHRHQNQVYEFPMPRYWKKQFWCECRGGHFKMQDGCKH